MLEGEVSAQGFGLVALVKAEAGLGLGANLNLWYDAQSRLGGGTNLTVLTGKKALQEITGSKKSGGHWLILKPTFFHQFGLIPNWPTTVTGCPLLSVNPASEA